MNAKKYIVTYYFLTFFKDGSNSGMGQKEFTNKTSALKYKLDLDNCIDIFYITNLITI